MYLYLLSLGSLYQLCHTQILVLIFHIGLTVLDMSFILFGDLSYDLSINCLTDHHTMLEVDFYIFTIFESDSQENLLTFHFGFELACIRPAAEISS